MVALGIFPGWARLLHALSCLHCVPKASHIRLQMNVLNRQLAGLHKAHDAVLLRGERGATSAHAAITRGHAS
jgi:hypothetical protein